MFNVCNNEIVIGNNGMRIQRSENGSVHRADECKTFLFSEIEIPICSLKNIQARISSEFSRPSYYCEGKLNY